MAFTLNSGALTAAVAVAGLATFFLSDSLANTGVLVIASKLYANSFFGMLNARRLVQRNSVVHFINDSEFRTERSSETLSNPRSSVSEAPVIWIRKEKGRSADVCV
ncbi:hypothetical protein EIP91_002759 [Steccherinum ochraceum]|uniref:DUF6534 domain-containing protein n=1 Tax=Steccherinum ochraceum TaxID=92696 RepID=A0A4R0RBL6_9APHY|nr:hypothetical protein EIP91_002759 [Steccherinum ochraceum]